MKISFYNHIDPTHWEALGECKQIASLGTVYVTVNVLPWLEIKADVSQIGAGSFQKIEPRVLDMSCQCSDKKLPALRIHLNF